MSESFAELFEQSLTEKKIVAGDIITGRVISISNNFVIVDAGLKSEAFIPVSQFMNEKHELEVQEGDDVEVALDSLENGYGETGLSREKAKRVAAWKQLEDAHESGEIVSVFVNGRVKGGFTVDIGVLKGFLPGSLVDIRPVRDTSYLEGKDIEVKIIKMDQKRNNVVVSRRAVMEAESQEERAALLDKLEEGQHIKGVVKNLTDYGAFVDLGGVDGLLHITDMSWKRVKHPSEVVTVGDEIDVKILKFDKERNRVSLGLKQMGDDPWLDITERYPESSRLVGKVSNITDYGCFVEIESGVEGLVHVSEMDWTNKNVNPNKIVNLGDEVEVLVLEIDQERRRISLGMKQCKSNPWTEFAAAHSVNDKISGKIKSITDFGIFIGLDGSIDGLVHLSDISWAKTGEEAIHDFVKGQELETVILAIDPDRERISLGIKQFEDNPIAKLQTQFPKGTVISGKVKEVDIKQAVIELADGVIGSIKASDVASEKVKDVTEYLKVDEEVDAKVVGYDSKKLSLHLSIKAMAEESSEAEAPTSATLGDLFKEKLNK